MGEYFLCVCATHKRNLRYALWRIHNTTPRGYNADATRAPRSRNAIYFIQKGYQCATYNALFLYCWNYQYYSHLSPFPSFLVLRMFGPRYHWFCKIVSYNFISFQRIRLLLFFVTINVLYCINPSYPIDILEVMMHFITFLLRLICYYVMFLCFVIARRTVKRVPSFLNNQGGNCEGNSISLLLFLLLLLLPLPVLFFLLLLWQASLFRSSPVSPCWI